MIFQAFVISAAALAVFVWLVALLFIGQTLMYLRTEAMRRCIPPDCDTGVCSTPTNHAWDHPSIQDVRSISSAPPNPTPQPASPCVSSSQPYDGDDAWTLRCIGALA